VLRINDNSWVGSLEPLKNCIKLTILHIKNTNLTSGLEYLPNSLEYFACSGTKLAEDLGAYGRVSDDGNYTDLLKAWKENQNSHNQQFLVLQSVPFNS
jgi:hypothetical protein